MKTVLGSPEKARTALAMFVVPVGIAAMELLISESLQIGRFLPLGFLTSVVPVAGLATGLLCAFLLLRGHIRITRRIVLAYLVLAAAELAAGVVALVLGMGKYTGGDGGMRLLGDSFLLWLSNILLFAMFYWTLDARLWTTTGQQRPRHFFYPQHLEKMDGYERWEPGLFAYVYLAFTVSTTYGPTDMPAVSAAARLLVMLQALIALILFTLTIARAVAIIG